MLKSQTFIDVFSGLGDDELTEDDESIIEEYTCSLFGYPKLDDINEARYLYFRTKCKPKSTEKPLDCIKSVDPSIMFPPCRSVLLQQIRRAWLVSRLYKNATVAEPLEGVSPLDFGYELIDGSMHIRWFEGDQVPTMLEEEEEEEANGSADANAESEEEETDCENDEDEEDDENDENDASDEEEEEGEEEEGEEEEEEDEEEELESDEEQEEEEE